MTDFALLLAAVVLAAAGGEAFLKAILAAAAHLRVPKAVAAASLAAFATSSPELTVSTVAALSGHPEIGLGDALGSNVANIALIFGIALLFGPIRTSRADFGRDFLLALAVPALTLVLALDGKLTRTDAAFLLLGFAAWLALLLRAAMHHRRRTQTHAAAPHDWPRTLMFGIFGLASLIAAGRMFVIGATGIAQAFAVDTFVIGALVVAIGTSLPELATVVLSRLRGHDDVGVGTLIGSNLFNGLAIVGVAASIHPIVAIPREVPLTLVAGMAALLLLIPARSGVIPRLRGLLLIAFYAGFVWATLAI